MNMSTYSKIMFWRLLAVTKCLLVQISLTWAMKKKANGEYQVRLAARGFKQTQGKSFIYHYISSPVMHDITVRIMLVLMLMGNMLAHLVNINGAFLLGQFKLDEQNYMKIPCGFEKFICKLDCCF